MRDLDVYVEQPAPPNYEFFIQENGAHSIACNAHIHNAVELLYVIKGRYRVFLEGEEYSIGQGDLVLFSSNAIHHVCTESDEENAYYVIKIMPSALLALSDSDSGIEYVMRLAFKNKSSRYVWRSDELAENGMRSALDSIIDEYSHAGYATEVAMKARIISLLVLILRQDDRAASEYRSDIVRVVYSAMTYVREHYSEDVDESALAARLGVSYSYFSRSFRRITGKSFKAYLNHTRIDHAAQLLCRDGLSVSEAAARCGFNSVSYFIRVFHTVMGNTPHDFKLKY